jgi:uncharacterized protein (DUF58 family)
MSDHAHRSPPPAAALIDPRALLSVRNLELRARLVVEGFRQGLHRSPYHGFSVEFTEYRQYSPGDDPRYLDWRVFARSDRFFIKKFEDETNLRCHLLVDQSRSMSFGSLGYTKEQYAATLAATLAYFLHLQGDATGLLTYDEAVRAYLPARHRPGHLRQLMRALEPSAGGRSTDLTEPINRLSALVRKRGLVVSISDFLAPIDRLESGLLTLTACGHEVAVFQVLDPAELTLNFDRAAVFEDLESADRVFIDPVAARAEYVPKMEAHCAAVRASCQKLGVAYHRISTAQPLELGLLAFLQGRRRRGLRRPAAARARR